jgi:hypothetical protein
MAIDSDLIVEHFKNRHGHGRGEFLHNAAYYLIRMILSQRSFQSVHDLTTFCENPENLRWWLPSESDRIIFSDGLLEGLQEFRETRTSASASTSTSTSTPTSAKADPALKPHGWAERPAPEAPHHREELPMPLNRRGPFRWRLV